jgi:hypothetical protein
MEIIECIQNVKVGSQLIFRKGNAISLLTNNGRVSRIVMERKSMTETYLKMVQETM